MRLIHNWRDGWRFWSVRLQALGLVLLGLVEAFPHVVYQAWAMLPPAMQERVDENIIRWAAYVTLAISIVARLIRQDKLHGKERVNETD